MTANKIYIVTPSFNSIETIERTIVSVVTQAGDFSIRYHVQDGGSTDGTVRLVNQWQARLKAGFPLQCKDVELTVERAKDAGMYDAIVRGFDKMDIPASAFMTWINSDDILMPGALSLISKVHDDFSPEQVSWVAGIPSVMRGDTPILSVDRPTPTKAISEGLCDGKRWEFVQQEGTFFRKWLWERIDPKQNFAGFKLAADWNLWRLFAHSAEYHQAAWPLGAFRIRDRQLSRENFKAYMAEIDQTIAPQTRDDSLRALVDTGGTYRRLLKARIPSGNLFVLEKLTDAQANYQYDKHFGSWPKQKENAPTFTAERVLFEAKGSGQAAPSATAAATQPASSPTTPVLTKVSPENFARFTYAKRSHWPLFKDLDVALFGAKKDPEEEQLKVYQDLLVLRFIKDNIPPGSRILDVGGGKSRILAHLAKTYDCWNVDKLEGAGNGPRELDNLPYRLVRDYMGNFNRELENNSFDFVFSISALEHVPQDDEGHFRTIVADLNRVVKPGGLNLHLFDVILKSKGFWTNKFTDYIFRNVATLNVSVTPEVMRADPDIYGMSEKAYNRTWLHNTKRPYEQHGLPTSLNILWRRQR